MRVKIITRHAPSNYGSLLQSIASIKVLECLGHECEIIDYQRPDEHGFKAVLTQLHKKKSFNDNPLKRLLYIAASYPNEKWAELKFNKMRKKYLKKTSLCENGMDLKRLSADIFMTGSDQVWGPVLSAQYDGAYFLDFVRPGIRKVAYAASFGRTEFTTVVQENYMRMLSDYDAIAVRESSGVDLLKGWNIYCIGQVLDPTLLLDSKEWSKYIQKERKDKYVLIYQIHNNPALNDYAKRFASKVGLPLMRVSPYTHQMFRGGKFICLPDLGDFLALIKGCSYMITDSFHGTAFAMNFNRQFIEVLPNNKTGSRNQSILQLTGLSNRILKADQDYSLAKQMIDYNRVNGIIYKERVKSMIILKKLLEEK